MSGSTGRQKSASSSVSLTSLSSYTVTTLTDNACWSTSDETNPPTKPTTAVLINPDTEIFVAPRPRHKSKPNGGKAPKSGQSDEQVQAQKSSTGTKDDKKPLASIKQATDTAEPSVSTSTTASPKSYPWLTDTAKDPPTTVETLPSMHLRSIPPAIFCQWDNCLRALEGELQADQNGPSGSGLGDERRWMIWANKKTLRRFERKTRAKRTGDRILVEAVASPRPIVELPRDAETDEGEPPEPRPIRKNRKAVMRALEGMPVDQVFLWPIWGSEGDVDSAWRIEDWDKIW